MELLCNKFDSLFMISLYNHSKPIVTKHQCINFYQLVFSFCNNASLNMLDLLYQHLIKIITSFLHFNPYYDFKLFSSLFSHYHLCINTIQYAFKYFNNFFIIPYQKKPFTFYIYSSLNHFWLNSFNKIQFDFKNRNEFENYFFKFLDSYRYFLDYISIPDYFYNQYCLYLKQFITLDFNSNLDIESIILWMNTILDSELNKFNKIIHYFKDNYINSFTQFIKNIFNNLLHTHYPIISFFTLSIHSFWITLQLDLEIWKSQFFHQLSIITDISFLYHKIIIINFSSQYLDFFKHHLLKLFNNKEYIFNFFDFIIQNHSIIDKNLIHFFLFDFIHFEHFFIFFKQYLYHLFLSDYHLKYSFHIFESIFNIEHNLSKDFLLHNDFNFHYHNLNYIIFSDTFLSSKYLSLSDLFSLFHNNTPFILIYFKSIYNLYLSYKNSYESRKLLINLNHSIIELSFSNSIYVKITLIHYLIYSYLHFIKKKISIHDLFSIFKSILSKHLFIHYIHSMTDLIIIDDNDYLFCKSFILQSIDLPFINENEKTDDNPFLIEKIKSFLMNHLKKFKKYNKQSLILLMSPSFPIDLINQCIHNLITLDYISEINDNLIYIP